MLRTFAFIVPLGALVALMLFGERTNQTTCPGDLAFLKSREILAEQPGVVDIANEGFRWVGDCKFTMTGYVNIDKGGNVDRADFEVVVALDPQSRKWQQVSLALR
jgi:hypothetical protein